MLRRLHTVLYSSSQGDVWRNIANIGTRYLSKIKVAEGSNSVRINEIKKGKTGKIYHAQTPIAAVKHRQAMKGRFPDGWDPPRKISREAMDGLRTLHAHDPVTFSTPILAEKFRISPEAVRRILKSKWVPKKDEKAKLMEKERRRKQEYIAKRIERERLDKWKQIDSMREEKEDQLTLV